MKRLLIASVLLVLFGTIGVANAAPANAFLLTIWNAALLPEMQTFDSPWLKALPSNPIVQPIDQQSGVSRSPFLLTDETVSGAINFDLETTNNPPVEVRPIPLASTIYAFLATAGFDDITHQPLFMSTCIRFTRCGNRLIAEGNFRRVTLFRFTFRLPTELSLSITHDDGVSLFHHDVTAPVNLLPADAADVTGPRTDAAFNLSPGDYDLWYLEAGAGPEPLPAVLQTDTFVAISVDTANQRELDRLEVLLEQLNTVPKR
jgi:hypothetical protein